MRKKMGVIALLLMLVSISVLGCGGKEANSAKKEKRSCGR